MSQNKLPIEGPPTIAQSSATTKLGRFRLTAMVGANANIASKVLKDAYAILANHEVDHLHSPSLIHQLRGIRNKLETSWH